MIISTWLAYILAREGTGALFPAKSTQDIPVVETETLSVLEHWLRKVRMRHAGGCRGSPIPRTGCIGKQGDPRFGVAGLGGSHGSCSQTQVYQASSSVRDEAMQERLDKIRSRGAPCSRASLAREPCRLSARRAPTAPAPAATLPAGN
uniref:Uncharacterized protein n=1 Tax=Apteryx owenii TaxID=8824 RepID=A0A8B9Q741_APTOW